MIHSLAEVTFVAQTAYQTGGTWDGTVKNLRFGWSKICVFRDGSPAQKQLCDMGATAVKLEELTQFTHFCDERKSLFDA